MSKVLIHSAYGLWPMLEYELDIVQNELDAGSTVTYLYCDGRQASCMANTEGKDLKPKKRLCYECKSRVNSGINWLTNIANFEVAKYDIVTKEESERINVMLADLDLKHKDKETLAAAVNVEKVDIYESAYSQLITYLRDSDPDLNINWNIFRTFLEEGIRSYISAKSHMIKFEPEKVYIFNGRLPRYRPMMRIAQQTGKEVLVYEYPSSNFQTYLISKNTYPHNIRETSIQFKKTFHERNPEFNEVKVQANEWFKGRSTKKFEGVDRDLFNNIFPHISQPYVIPIEWNQNNFHLVFFISTQDELNQIEENVALLPFDQITAINLLRENFPEINLTIKIHPRLNGCDLKFTRKIKSFKKFLNISVIHPESEIDSYNLVSQADLILTFGSTIGVEAAFMKKPVLNVGSSIYESFGCVVSVFNKEEFIEIIKLAIQGNFSKFPTENERYVRACEFAYAYRNHGVKAKYVARESFFNGVMTRNGKNTKIDASLLIVLLNRIIDLPKKIINAICILYSSPIKMKTILFNPSKIKKYLLQR